MSPKAIREGIGGIGRDLEPSQLEKAPSFFGGSVAVLFLSGTFGSAFSVVFLIEVIES